ncbi:MAG: hypothetical protein ABIO78_03470, partial [Thermoanaerobaculia bacterium]
MKSLFSSPTCAAAIAIALWGSAPAAAQVTGSTRPYRALFGGSTANPGVHHSLDVTVSVLTGYERNDMAEQGAPTNNSSSALLENGFYSGVSANLAYTWQGRRVQVGANAGTNTRYYHERSELLGVGHSAGFGVAADVGRRMRVFASQSVTYAPSYFYSLLPDLGALPPGAVIGGGDYPLGDQPVYVYDTTASVTFGLSRRGSFEALSSNRYSDLGSSGGLNASSLRSYSFGGRYRHGLTHNASLRIGYVYRNGQYGLRGPASSTAVHDIDAGVDYRRGLSLTRRTTLDFRVGSSAVNTPLGGTQEQRLQYRLVGDLGLTHEMGRTWRARFAYNRGLGFAEGFTQPVFSDGVGASVAGFLSRRLDFSANGGFSVGDVGLSNDQNRFTTGNTALRLRFALRSM